MLERLFTSQARVKILGELLLNSNKEYHIRELSRIISISPIYVQKELKNLQSLGLLESRNMLQALRVPNSWLQSKSPSSGD
jgi:predicted transcriptional regulator